MRGQPQTATMKAFLNSILSARSTAAALAERGWDKELNKIGDENLRAVITEAFEHLAGDLELQKAAEALAADKAVHRAIDRAIERLRRRSERAGTTPADSRHWNFW